MTELKLFVGAGHFVAQIFNLLYRRLVVGLVSAVSSLLGFSERRRLQICDTAECNSALRGFQIYLRRAVRREIVDDLPGNLGSKTSGQIGARLQVFPNG